MTRAVCPVCRMSLRKTDPPSRLYCCGSCAAQAKAHARRKGVRCCHTCRKWRKVTVFSLGGHTCQRCEKAKEIKRRRFPDRAPRRCEACERKFKPHCNAHRFCSVKCREKLRDLDNNQS